MKLLLLFLFALILIPQPAISQLKPLKPLSSGLKPLKPLTGTSSNNIKPKWLIELEKERERNLKIAEIRAKKISAKKSNFESPIEFSIKEGYASYYGSFFHGKKMANGEIFDMNDPHIAAHKYLKLGTSVIVTDIRPNGKSIKVIIKDRGPYKPKRIIDLSKAAAQKLSDDFLQKGIIPVRVTPIFKSNSFAWPVLGRTITQYYKSGHRALDIDGVKGQPIFTIANGKVIESGWHRSHGKYIVINHANGLQSTYGHLSQILVRLGNIVFKGQIIGQIGNTGCVRPGLNGDGSHLHLEIRQNNRLINPLTILK